MARRSSSAWTWFVLVPVVGMTVAACPASSTSDCDTFCSNGGSLALNYDCSTLCDNLQKIADGSGCDAAYSAFVSCAASVADGGAVWEGDACVSQESAFVRCSAPFCSKTENVAECEASIPAISN
jgi:hypothetical protein